MVLTRFNQAFERHKAEVGQSQYSRYKGGRLPRLLVWLAERPELAAALAEDARELATRSPATAQKGGDA